MSYADYDLTEPDRKTISYGPHHSIVLRALRAGPLSDQGIYDRIVKHRGKVISGSGCRTRRQELVETFKLVKSSGTALTEAGRTCKTWALTDAGRVRADAEREADRQLQLGIERAAA